LRYSFKLALPFRSTFGSSGGGSTVVVERKPKEVEELSSECLKLLEKRLGIFDGIGFPALTRREMDDLVSSVVKDFFLSFTCYTPGCLKSRFYATLAADPDQYLDWFKEKLRANPRCCR